MSSCPQPRTLRVIKRHLVVVAMSLPFCMSSSVFAAGIWLYDLGSPSSGRSAAGSVASAEDAVTAFSNPAGMSLLEHSGWVAGVNALYVNADFEPGPETTVPGGGGDNAGGFSPGGGLYYANRHSDRTQWGLALNSWFGLGLDYDDDWSGRYFAQESEIFTVALTGTVSRRLSDRVSVGGGLSVLYGELTVESAVNNVLDGLEDGQIDINSDDVGLGFNFGVMLEASEATRFGLTYRSEVELDLDNALSGSGIGPTLLAALQQMGLQPGATIDLDVVIPQAVLLGVYHRVSDRFQIMGDVGWQDWSEFGSIGISINQENPVSLTTPSKYDDTWRAAVGMEWEFKPGEWTLSSGISYDSSPVSSTVRTPELPVDRQIRLSVGLHRHSGRRFDWSVSYTYVDSGTGGMNIGLGPLTGNIQGSYSPYNVHSLAFSLIGKPRR